MELFGQLCRLRLYRADEADALCSVADDLMVARWMTRRFPHPYTRADADEWIPISRSAALSFAIEVDGSLAGGIGVERLGGERSGSGLFGYWLGRDYWGHGIGTDAARTLSDYALGDGGLRRIEATVFAPNVASARVLEKCGFVLEATLPAYYVDRNDAVCDGLLYGRVLVD
ncbi:MAG TPA: GNAT family N-acetyltransferase [Candidatus Cybelea sp.]